MGTPRKSNGKKSPKKSETTDKPIKPKLKKISSEKIIKKIPRSEKLKRQLPKLIEEEKYEEASKVLTEINDITSRNITRTKSLLEKALVKEDYERASILRDRLKRFEKN